MMRVGVLILALAAGIAPAVSRDQDFTIDLLNSFVAEAGADPACLINFGADRGAFNGLVWKKAGTWQAIVFRAHTPPSSHTKAPCENEQFACAVVEDPVRNFDGICDPANPQMLAGLGQSYLHPAKVPGITALSGAEGLLDLARGLLADDTQVAQLTNALVWFNKGGPHGLSARLRTSAGDILVVWLRTTIDSALVDKLSALADSTGHHTFDLVGRTGALSGTSLYSFSGAPCQSINEPDAFWQWVSDANAIVRIERVETEPTRRRRLYDDAVQNALGGADLGSPIVQGMVQDPRIYLFVGAPCP